MNLSCHCDGEERFREAVKELCCWNCLEIFCHSCQIIQKWLKIQRHVHLTQIKAQWFDVSCWNAPWELYFISSLSKFYVHRLLTSNAVVILLNWWENFMQIEFVEVLHLWVSTSLEELNEGFTSWSKAPEIASPINHTFLLCKTDFNLKNPFTCSLLQLGVVRISLERDNEMEKCFYFLPKKIKPVILITI